MAQSKLPPGVRPIAMRESELKTWGMKTGDGMFDVVPYAEFEKAAILADIEKRGFQSAFQPHLKAIKKFSGDMILLIQDEEDDDGNFAHGENYWWCSTPAKYKAEKERIQAEEDKALNADKVSTAAGTDDAAADSTPADDEKATEKEEEEEDMDFGTGPLPEYHEVPIVPRPWTSLGSDLEMDAARVVNTRPKISFTITKKRKDFGIPFVRSDWDGPPGGDKVTGYPAHRQRGAEDVVMTLDMGFQAGSSQRNASSQTRWYRKVNKGVQSEPVMMEEKERLAVMESPALASFVELAAGQVQSALSQNDTVDLFGDDFAGFEEEESMAVSSSSVTTTGTGGKLENNLRTVWDFSNLTYSKGRDISCICWHPTEPDVVAFACTEKLGFEQWVDVSGLVFVSSVLIVRRDAVYPEFVLKAPGNVQCFSFNPHNPDIIVAGLSSGQVVLWDLSTLLTQSQDAAAVTANASASDTLGATGAAMSEHSADTKINAPSLISEHTGADSHPNVVESVLSKANKRQSVLRGSATNAGASVVVQPTMVSAVEYSHARAVTDVVWLPRNMRVKRYGELDKEVQQTWNPMFLTVSPDGKLSFWSSTAEAEWEALQKLEPANRSKHFRWVPVWSTPFNKPGSTSPDDQNRASVTKLTLEDNKGDSTRFVAVTEEGEIIFGDFGVFSSEFADSVKGQLTVVTKVVGGHVHPCRTVEKSPHLTDCYLSVGDWTFSIWKYGLDYPVFQSCCADDYLTCGAWSPTRPGVIITTKDDGSFDVWDMVDQSHRESLQYSGWKIPITSLKFWQSQRYSTQYLAVGDAEGTLKVLEIPRPLRRKAPRERHLVTTLLSREQTRKEEESKRPMLMAPMDHKTNTADVFRSSDQKTSDDTATDKDTVQHSGDDASAAAANSDVLSAAESATQKAFERLLKQYEAEMKL